MDHKAIVNRLTEKTGCTAAQTDALISALARVMCEVGAELDSAAIPGFGTFAAVKTDEHIATDAATGRRMLMPPAVTLTFTPSIILRKKLAEA